MSEHHPDRPEPAHGPEGEHGGLEDLGSLEPGAPEAGKQSSSIRSGKFAEDQVAGGEMRFRVTVDGVAYDVAVEPLDTVAGAVDDPGVAPPKPEAAAAPPPVQPLTPRSSEAPAPTGHPLACPVAGVVVRLLVAVGDAVDEDQPVAIVEALKVESRVLAPHDGVVSAVHVSAGDRVKAGDVLVRL